MGYYTKFELIISDSYENACAGNNNLLYDEELKVRRRLGEISRLYESEIAEKDVFNFFDWDAYKWYNHVEDMENLSIEFPEYWFVLYGEGEESGDLWKEMYHNSLYQRINAEITYPEFLSEEEWKA